MLPPWGLSSSSPAAAAYAFGLLLLLQLPGSVRAQFENTAIVRTIELGGPSVHVTTTYAVRATEAGVNTYTFSLSEEDGTRTSWIEARVKGQKDALPIERYGFNPRSHSIMWTAELPKALGLNETTSLVLETVQTHATYPWPKEAAQGDDQLLKYETDLLIISPYNTTVQRTKIRSPTPRIKSYTEKLDMSAFTNDEPVTKSGATLTYGPYSNIPESASITFANKYQRRVAVQYGYDHPVLELRKLRRAAEISHWSANLNIQDEMHLYNAGPKLKGQFSRIEHQSQKFYKRQAPHVLSAFVLQLPPRIHDTYYYDLIGNVSTSRLRQAEGRPSVLELRPRYPLMGGWNYSFTLGWDAPLDNSAGWDPIGQRYVLGVPIMNALPGSVVDDGEVKIIFPEGATDIEVFPPFPPKMISKSTHVTYLDTVGRPAVTFSYENLTDKHLGIIYVTYKVPFAAHLKKPIAVTSVIFGLFVFAIGVRRVDLTLQKRK